MLHGIDISNWQAGFNVANSNVDFCIVKATEGTYFVDPYCDGFIQQCISSNILFGFYHFNQTGNASDEAKFFASNTEGYNKLGIPVLDYEVHNENDASWVQEFMQTYHDITGVWPLLYCSASWCNIFSGTWLPEECGLWVAGYPTTYTEYTDDNMPYDISPWSFAAIWQFTNSLNINGYSVDGDIAYMDAEAWNKYAGNYSNKPQYIVKDTETLAWEVIGGKWGNGDDRKNALENAGYNYDEIQNKVNELINRKSIDELANEVIQGKWGNGSIRKNALTQAGYNYDDIQSRVNELLL